MIYNHLIFQMFHPGLIIHLIAKAKQGDNALGSVDLLVRWTRPATQVIFENFKSHLSGRSGPPYVRNAVPLEPLILIFTSLRQGFPTGNPEIVRVLNKVYRY